MLRWRGGLTVYALKMLSGCLERRVRVAALSLLVGVLPLIGVAFVGQAAVVAVTVKAVRDSTFGGYVADYSAPGNRVDDVKGLWVVPTIQPSSGASLVLESVAIGSSDVIVQIGTSQVVSNGAVVYRAWYWVSPENSGGPTHITQLDGKVGPGKVVGAEIRHVSGESWTIGLIVGTNGGFPDIFSTQVVHTAGKAAADWLVQPDPGGSPLASFDSVNFFWTNATVNGVESRLDQLNNKKVTLSDPSFTCDLADTTEITQIAGGDSFTVTFLQSAAPCSIQNPPKPPTPNLLVPIVAGVALIGGVVAVTVFLVVRTTRRKNVSTQTVVYGSQTGPEASGLRSFCSNCFQPMKPGARFCDNCGRQAF